MEKGLNNRELSCVDVEDLPTDLKQLYHAFLNDAYRSNYYVKHSLECFIMVFKMRVRSTSILDMIKHNYKCFE